VLPRPQTAPEAMPRSERLSALFEAKERATEDQPEETATPPAEQAETPKLKRQPVIARRAAEERPASPAPKPEAAPPSQTEDSTTAYLLSRKRQRGKKEEGQD
jgi:hypothetical protein